jgi:predicted nucleotide-binding protein
MAIKYRHIKDEFGDSAPFTVFIIHGHSDAREVVEKHIKQELRFATVVSMTQPGGAAINEKIRKAVWHDCDCAVAILSADDQLVDGTFNARPNVLYEIGYCAGFFDLRYWEDDDRLDAVLLLKDKRTQIPTDFLGLEYFSYDRTNAIDVSATFKQLDYALEKLYEKIGDYFSDC